MNVFPLQDCELFECSNHILVISVSSRFHLRYACVRHPGVPLLDRQIDEMERDWLRNTGWDLFSKYSRANFFSQISSEEK